MANKKACRPQGATQVACASNVRTLRKAKGWSQQELAQRAGLSRWAVATAEAGEKGPTLRTVDRLAQALGVPPWLLLLAPIGGHQRRRRKGP